MLGGGMWMQLSNLRELPLPQIRLRNIQTRMLYSSQIVKQSISLGRASLQKCHLFIVNILLTKTHLIDEEYDADI